VLAEILTARVVFSRIGNIVVFCGSAATAWRIARAGTNGSELISRPRSREPIPWVEQFRACIVDAGVATEAPSRSCTDGPNSGLACWLATPFEPISEP